ncbi:hypothetical protein L6452_01552 [Arctium lappa]|uniref:Uncharacterized protein n=1 Tax=Arctium lappa TaxID=4217 RepID=A0ACB9FHT4_ARCLA|nr:hypothetical protein L6452_01552 [Arctium lappa]
MPLSRILVTYPMRSATSYERKEEADAGKEASDDLVVVEGEGEPKPKKASKNKGVGLAEDEGKQKPEKLQRAKKRV